MTALRENAVEKKNDVRPDNQSIVMIYCMYIHIAAIS